MAYLHIQDQGCDYNIVPGICMRCTEGNYMIQDLYGVLYTKLKRLQSGIQFTGFIKILLQN